MGCNYQQVTKPTPAWTSHEHTFLLIDKDRPRAHQITDGYSRQKHQSSKFTLERVLFCAPPMPHR